MFLCYNFKIFLLYFCGRNLTLTKFTTLTELNKIYKLTMETSYSQNVICWQSHYLCATAEHTIVLHQG